jgi:hypothetical protein
VARPRDPETRPSEAAPTPAQAASARTEHSTVSSTTRAGDFWALLGAVAPESGVGEPAILPVAPVLSAKPSFQELLARVVAAE